MKISLFEVFSFSKLKKLHLQYLSMGKYFEGYYCKDDNSVNGIGTDSSRKVLHTISRSYPFGITIKEISNQTKTEPSTIDHALKALEAAGFITKVIGKRSRGKPAQTAVQYNPRAYRYHIENIYSALNEDDEYQFAPGYTKYTSDFLYAWKILVEKNQLDGVYSSLIRILTQVMTKITSANDRIKKLGPKTDKNMQCQFCGINHDARDFIRATLLRILNEFERSNMFMDFISEKQFISKDIYDGHHLLNQEKSKKEVQAKEWLDNLAPDAKGIAKSILEKSLFSIEQLMSKVNKLTEQHFDQERLGKYTQMDEQKALSIIANELSINLDYASKLPQYQSTPAEISIIEVEQSQNKDGIKVTLHRIEIAAEYTAAFLTLENTSNNHDTYRLYHEGAVATQGDYELKVTSKGPSYKSFRKNIQYGTKDYGAVKFERVHYNEPTIKFEFPVIESDREDHEGRAVGWSFGFELQIQST
jgi:DNA-binding transcriptional ArsR family regulator